MYLVTCECTWRHVKRMSILNLVVKTVCVCSHVCVHVHGYACVCDEPQKRKCLKGLLDQSFCTWLNSLSSLEPSCCHGFNKNVTLGDPVSEMSRGHLGWTHSTCPAALDEEVKPGLLWGATIVIGVPLSQGWCPIWKPNHLPFSVFFTKCSSGNRSGDIKTGWNSPLNLILGP